MKRVETTNSRRSLSSYSFRTDKSGDRSLKENNNGEHRALHMAGAPPMEAPMVCMVVVEDGPSMAFASYDEERNEILLEAVHASDDTKIVVERFLHTARPNLVLVGNKIVNNAAFLEMITQPLPALPIEEENASSDENHTGETSDAFTGMRFSKSSLPYRMLKTSSFEIRACRALILQKLRVLSLFRQHAREHVIGFDDPYRAQRHFPLTAPYESYRPSSYHSLAAVVDFDSKVQIQALGALISFLQGTIFRLEDNGTVTINQIVQAKSSMYMHINASTFAALHIFSTEHHPLIAKGPGNAKEGFSLYSLLDRTQSKGGRQLLREWMMKPLIDLNSIIERQDAVELFLQPQLHTTTGVLLALLAKIGPVDKILTRMQKCATHPMDFIVLTRTLAAAVAISNILQTELLPALQVANDRIHCLIYKIFRRCNVPVLAELQQEIINIVDEDSTCEVRTSVVVRRGFHQQLDEMKDQYESLEEILEEVGAEIQRHHPELDLSVVFVPQVGFLVALSKAMANSQGIGLREDFQHIFNQDNEAFFKTKEMRQLDDDIGDLHGLIKDTESMIVTDLEETLLDSETELRENFKALSELDCILALANCAFDFNFVRPQMLEISANRICIKDGRHPLQEIITEKDFVPNDIRIDREERVNIITGPNFSGKSCYLRQVGVLVYMAHIGSFIPCKEAEISVVDQICARISAIETCAVPQSSFQLDLTQMAAILRRCTSNSLVLIDEFGKGTSPVSGIAILGAAINNLAKLGCKTVCTTHFLELFSMRVINDKVNGIKARRMAIHLSPGSDDTAVPLFKMEEGVASSSAGLICAKKAGLDPEIISRAKEIIGMMRERRPIEAVPSAVPKGINLSRNKIRMLDFFLLPDGWEQATDDQIRALIKKVACVAV